MADRSWFFASQGQQQGPFPEAKLRELIATGKVTPETLVWTEGMANWQKAGDVPGLLADGGPATMPGSPGLPASGVGYGGGALSVDFGIWDFTWRSLVLIIGLFDLLTMGKVALSDPPWQSFSTEVYVTLGLIYIAFCFAMSRYSRGLERELGDSRHR